MKHIVLVVVAVLILVFAAGCSAGTSDDTSDVTVGAAKSMWTQKAAVILDVRTVPEYNDGHVPSAVLIPLDELPDRISEVPKNKKVLVICRSGNRSAKAVKMLREKGFTNVYNVTGGMLKWDGPVEKK